VGTPVITVPLGAYPPGQAVVRNDRKTLVETGPNIPFGVSFIGKAWSEASLIGFPYAFEQRTMVRSTIKPYIVPRTELADVVGQKTNVIVRKRSLY